MVEITSHRQTLSLLRQELSVSQSRLTSLESGNSTQSRILELRNNPTATHAAVKQETLRSLRAENAALLAQLINGGAPPTPSTSSSNTSAGEPLRPSKVVPISTLENARREMAECVELVAEKEKRMSRLKQIWSAKSLEFREAVASILGYRMDFMPNGRVRVTSMFDLFPAPPSKGKITDGAAKKKSNGEGAGEAGDGDGDGDTTSETAKEEQSIIFDGENGTMKVSGGPGSRFRRDIAGLIRFWVEERKSVPGFLAALTLEGYERSLDRA